VEYCIGDIVRSKSGYIYAYIFNPYLNRFMWRKIGKNLEAIWWELSEINVNVEEKIGNIFEQIAGKE